MHPEMGRVVRTCVSRPPGAPDLAEQSRRNVPRSSVETVLDELALGYFRATTDGLLLQTNEAFGRMLRLALLPASASLDLPHLCVRPSEGERLLREIVSHGVHRHEIELYRADGSTLWASITATPDAASGGYALMHGVIEDVSDAKRARDALSAASGATGDGFLRWLVSHAASALDAAICFVAALNPDTDGDTITTLALWQNGTYGENFDYPLAGTPCERVVAEAACCFPERLSELFPGEPLLVQMGAQSYVGRPLFFDDHIVGLMSVIDTKPLIAPLSAAGVLESFAARAGMEVAQLRQVRTFRQRSEVLERTLESVRHPFYVINVDDYSVETASAACGFENVGRDSRCYALTHGAASPCAGTEHGCPIEELRRTRRPVRLEHVHATTTGDVRVFEVHAHPIFGEDGRLKQAIEYNLDITDRKRAEDALRTSEARFRYLYQTSPVPMYTVDDQGRICDVNASLLERTGYEADDLIGQPADCLAASASARDVTTLLNPQFWRSGLVKDVPYTLATKDGGTREVLLTCLGTTATSGRRINISVALDVSDARRAEAAAREGETRYALVASTTNDGLWDWDLGTNEVQFSARWKALLGHAPEEIGTHPSEWLERVHPDDRDRLSVALSLHRDGVSSQLELEHRVRHCDGDYRWVIVRGLAARDSKGEAQRMAGSMADISERKLAEERLRHHELHDALTGLPNRVLFMDRLARAAEQASRGGDDGFGVLLVDLDRFSIVNESLGHAVGDELLVAAGARLTACVSPRDTVARFVGDAFALLLERVSDASDAARVAERCRQALALPFELPSGGQVFASASVGIALATGGECRAEDLLREADTARHRAKAEGGARHVVFDTAMQARAVARLELEADLRRALAESRFLLHYQPIQDLATGRLAGFEALARWSHPRRGSVPPDEFIPVLEEIGLIHVFGVWALGEASRQAQEWRNTGFDMLPLGVSVNLSALQLLEPDLVACVLRALERAGLPAGGLRIEITEGAIMKDPVAAAATVLQLRDVGVRVHVDDFGTGYSSLSYLHRFAISALKIPAVFVASLDHDCGAQEIVRAIVSLGHALGLQAIAEGVERPAQLGCLRALGCGFAQGWLISEALAPERCLDYFDACPPAA